MFRVCCKNGVLDYAYEILELNDTTKRKILANKAKNWLEQEAFLSEENAVIAINIILEALNVGFCLETNSVKNINSKSDSENVVKNSSVTTVKQKKEQSPTKNIICNHIEEINDGLVEYEMGNLENAERIFRRVIRMDSLCAEAFLGLLLVCPKEKRKEYHDKFIQCASDERKELWVAVAAPPISKKF